MNLPGSSWLYLFVRKAKRRCLTLRPSAKRPEGRGRAARGRPGNVWQKRRERRAEPSKYEWLKLSCEAAARAAKLKLLGSAHLCLTLLGPAAAKRQPSGARPATRSVAGGAAAAPRAPGGDFFEMGHNVMRQAHLSRRFDG